MFLENVLPLNPAEQFNDSIDHIGCSSGSFYDIQEYIFSWPNKKRNLEDERNAHNCKSLLLATVYSLNLYCAFGTGLPPFFYLCSQFLFYSVLYLNASFKGFRVSGKRKLHTCIYVCVYLLYIYMYKVRNKAICFVGFSICLRFSPLPSLCFCFKFRAFRQQINAVYIDRCYQKLALVVRRDLLLNSVVPAPNDHLNLYDGHSRSAETSHRCIEGRLHWLVM